MSVISFPQDACLSSAVALRTTLLDALETSVSVAIDLGGITRVDLSLLQIVEAGRREAAQRGAVLTLVAPAPPVVRDCLDRAGLPASFTPQDQDFWFHGDPRS